MPSDAPGPGGVQGLGHPAHRAGTDLAAEHRGEGERDLAGGETEDETGQDHPVDVGGAAGVGADHRERREAPGAGNRERDLAELGQQPTAIAPIAPVGLGPRRHLFQVTVDRKRHPVLENPFQGFGAGAPIILAPLDPFRLHRLHHPERTRYTLDRRRL